MAVYDIAELKTLITDTVYQNNQGLVDADIVRDRMHDTLDSLEAGVTGPMPNHQWVDFTKLQFENPDHSWGPLADLRPAIEFNWSGTQLGVRAVGEPSYVYSDIFAGILDENGNYVFDGNIIATGDIMAYYDFGNYPNLWDNLPVASTGAIGAFKLDPAGPFSIDINNQLQIDDSNYGLNETELATYLDTHQYWNASNDGAGSGLNADKLDGQHGSYYYSSANFGKTQIDALNINAATLGGQNAAHFLNVNTDLYPLLIDGNGNFVFDGNIIATGDIMGYYDFGNYPNLWDNMPIASATQLGGVKVGANLTIDGNGVLSASGGAPDQTLSFSNPNLSISAGNTVDLSALTPDLSGYYTSTQVDAWRNGTTQAEMGYVHGVTSDIQTQLNDKANSSTLSNYATLATAQTITGQKNFTQKVGIGTINPNNKFKIDYTGISGLPNAINNDTSAYNADNVAGIQLKSNNNGLFIGVNNTNNSRQIWLQSGHNHSAFASYTGKLLLNPLGGSVGINVSNPSEQLEVGGNVKATGEITAYAT